MAAMAGDDRLYAGSDLLVKPVGVTAGHVFHTTGRGDVNVHLSCALHSATPPIHSERRVTYSSLRLPGDTQALDAQVKAVRDQAGRDTYAPT